MYDCTNVFIYYWFFYVLANRERNILIIELMYICIEVLLYYANNVLICYCSVVYLDWSNTLLLYYWHLTVLLCL